MKTTVLALWTSIGVVVRARLGHLSLGGGSREGAGCEGGSLVWGCRLDLHGSVSVKFMVKCERATSHAPQWGGGGGDVEVRWGGSSEDPDGRRLQPLSCFQKLGSQEGGSCCLYPPGAGLGFCRTSLELS